MDATRDASCKPHPMDHEDRTAGVERLQKFHSALLHLGCACWPLEGSVGLPNGAAQRPPRHHRASGQGRQPGAPHPYRGLRAPQRWGQEQALEDAGANAAAPERHQRGCQWRFALLAHPTAKPSPDVPLRYDGRLYGRIYLGEKPEGTPFSAEDEQHAQCCADALALVLALHRKRFGHEHTALPEYSQQERTLARLSPVGVFLSDAQGDFLYVTTSAGARSPA